MRRKIIRLDGFGIVTVYSLDDGHTWSDSVKALQAYADRYQRERRELQRQFSTIDTAEQFDIKY